MPGGHDLTPADADLDNLIAACFQRPTDADTLTRFYDAFRLFVMAILISIAPSGSRLYEDAYQSAFLKFMEIFRRGRDPRINYLPYLVAVAKNCLIDGLRRQRREVPLDELVEEGFAGISPDESHRQEARLALLEAIPQLSGRCHIVLEQYYVAGVPILELARRLKIGEKSVYVILQRCRGELKALISGC